MRDISPLLKGVPHLKLIILKLTARDDFESIINQAWETESPSQAAKLKLKFQGETPLPEELTGPGSFSQIAQAIRRMKDIKYSQANKAKEALIAEIRNRKNVKK